MYLIPSVAWLLYKFVNNCLFKQQLWTCNHLQDDCISLFDYLEQKFWISQPERWYLILQPAQRNSVVYVRKLRRKYLLKCYNKIIFQKKEKEKEVCRNSLLSAWLRITLHLLMSPFHLIAALVPTVTDCLHCHIVIFLYSTYFCNKTWKWENRLIS